MIACIDFKKMRRDPPPTKASRETLQSRRTQTRNVFTQVSTSTKVPSHR